MKQENHFSTLSIANDRIKMFLIDELVEMVLSAILQTTEIQEVIEKDMVLTGIPIKDGKETRDKAAEDALSNTMDIIIKDSKGSIIYHGRRCSWISKRKMASL